MDVYNRLRTMAMDFTQLGEKMKSLPKGSKERQPLEKEMLKKYAEFEKNTEVKSMKKQHELLKQKLHVIKMRVKEFDDKLPLSKTDTK